ncbi:hypothetical protein LTV02_30005 [Nocardia yamanashiensis]|uniref:hypothetical protein n=1 Tax=Nocardia yamanashiensis TaxID=209247 RepID=UPI001E5AB1EA|nr:hypothetical protein [Nocardia yamanashiensis]UGT40235.1 hypothetical protein LTV02_30005 [Nocardia yamanashiensis]
MDESGTTPKAPERYSKEWWDGPKPAASEPRYWTGSRTAVIAAIIAILLGLVTLTAWIRLLTRPDLTSNAYAPLLHTLAGATALLPLIGGLLLLFRRTAGRVMVIASAVVMEIVILVAYIRVGSQDDSVGGAVGAHLFLIGMAVLAAVPATGRWIAGK